MRPRSAFSFFVTILVSLSLQAQSAPAEAASLQTARQALIEMFFGQAPDHLEKHLPDVTRQTLQKVEGSDSRNALGAFSLLTSQARAGKAKFETFDTGPTLLSFEGAQGGDYQKVEITVERDELAGDQDEIELAVHAARAGKEEALPLVLRFTFSMKMETGVWRLNEIGVNLRLPLTDPAFLKSIEERSRAPKASAGAPRGEAASQSNAASPMPGQRIRVSKGVAQGMLVSRVQPIYPPEARSSGIQGTAVLKAVISKAGEVVSVELVSGDPMLAPAAIDAVKQWRYRPYLLNGKAVEVETQVVVNFTLRGQ